MDLVREVNKLLLVLHDHGRIDSFQVDVVWVAKSVEQIQYFLEMVLSILRWVVFEIDSAFEDGLAHIFVEDDVEFGEFAYYLLRLLHFAHEASPLLLLNLHNKIKWLY